MNSKPFTGIRYLLQDQISPQSGAGETLRALLRGLFVVRHLSTLLFRASQSCGRRVPALGALLKQTNHVITGADLAWQAEVGRGLVLHHPTGVVWGPGVCIGRACRVQQGVTLGGSGSKTADGSPTIGDEVIIGAGAKVIGPVSVGSNSTIGANAVVLSDVPDHSIAVGVPARTRKANADRSEGVQE
ncbi:serine O-acetyltransferase [Plantibacter sp. Mn2098]|uniref:serine O-acetyltransferase n=1 Tax=Plantibacter sp. Mn2098 TaxID=3395266 RepID=UPI003BDB4146